MKGNYLHTETTFVSFFQQYKCQSARKNSSGNDDSEVGPTIHTSRLCIKNLNILSSQNMFGIFNNASFSLRRLWLLQEGLRGADFSTTLTVFGLKPRSGAHKFLMSDLRYVCVHIVFSHLPCPNNHEARYYKQLLVIRKQEKFI